MERTPASTLNASVSCESIAVPEYQPLTDRRPEINTSGETCNDCAAPMTTSVPLRPRPPCTALMASPLVTVARMTFAPPSFEQFRRRVLRLAVNVVLRAQFPRQRLLVLPARDADRPETHLRRVLHAEMAEAAEAQHRDHVAGPRVAVAQRVVSRDARAHQRRGFHRRTIPSGTSASAMAGATM